MRRWPSTVNLPGIAIAGDLSFGIALLSTLMEIFISLLNFLCATTITPMEMTPLAGLRDFEWRKGEWRGEQRKPVPPTTIKRPKRRRRVDRGAVSIVR